MPLDTPTVSAAAGLILLAASWPFVELWSKRPFRRTFPKLAAGLFASLLAYAAVVACLTIFTPRLVAVLAGIAGIVIVVQLWRARASYGVSAGLPPGSLSLLPVGAWLDQSFYQKQGEIHGNVFKSSHFLNPMVCIIGLKAGLRVLQQYEDKAVIPPKAAFARYIPCSYIRSMTPEDHDKYRPLLQAAVSDEVTDAHAADAGTIFAKHLARMQEDCQQSGRGLRVTRYTAEALYEVLFKLFFGVEPQSEEEKTFREIYRILDSSHQRRATIWSPPDRLVHKNLEETLALLNRRIDGFETNPDRWKQRPPSCYIEAAFRHGGRDAVDQVVLLNLVYLLQVTCTDLTGLSDWILKKLSDNPGWQQRFRETVHEHGFHSPQASAFADRLVSETFRLEQSEHIYRKVIQPIEVNGFKIPKGWLLRICVRESHHCSPVFEDPEVFNPDRFLNRTYGTTEYSPFGMYRRRCIGVYTGIRLGGIFARAIVESHQWEVTNPGTPEFRGWHWTPGSNFTIRLEPVRVPR